MNRVAAIVLASLVLSVSAHAGPKAAPVDYDHLVHKWKQVKADGEFKLDSTYPAPAPFSMNGDPEATLEMSADKVSPGYDTLEKIVPGEMTDIRKQIQIADYEEQDGKKPVNGIATWYETIDGTRVAFIKYRAGGVVGQAPILPMTVIHSILIRGKTIFFTHLIVRFGEHQDEVRHDQRVLIHKEITAAPGGGSHN